MAKQNPANTVLTPPISERLRKLLELLNIVVVCHVDDANNLTDFDVEIVIGEIQKIYELEKEAEMLPIQLDAWDRTLPREESIESLRAIWGTLNIDQKKELYTSLLKISNSVDQTLDFERTSLIAQHFPGDLIKFLSPQQWDQERDGLAAILTGNKKAFILFDEDLTHAGAEYAARRGQDLIVQILGMDIKDKVISTLLTQKVNSPKDELGFRDTVIGERQDLSVNDFFPLAKTRLDDPELFGDGIKKALLNRHLEAIKSHTVKIISDAYSEAIKAIKKFDTYDFDDTILKTSIKDGIWEPETIIRIADIVFENQLKKKMVETEYPLKVNPELKAVQAFSEIIFTSPPNVSPYSEKLILRHHEIYDSGSLINPLRKPLENGDIFQLGDNKYILVAQACDMAVRKKEGKVGLRTAKIATLLKINVLNDKDFDKKLAKGHFLKDQHPLPYFNVGSKDVGVVDFKDYVIVDIDILDLCVFNEKGECSIDLNKLESVAYLSKIWEDRYSIIVEKIQGFQFKIAGIRRHLRRQRLGILSRAISEMIPRRFRRNALLANNSMSAHDIEMEFYPKFVLASSTPVVDPIKLDGDHIFDFSMKRVGKYKDYGATYLLERYTRHLSRIAEPHDFAGGKN